jgi:hypothetical protein
MKIRLSFVSNSSSSSFIIDKKNIDDNQIKAIKNHVQVADIIDKHQKALFDELKSLGYDNSLLPDYWDTNFSDKFYFEYRGSWNINETNDKIILDCNIDNFDMYKFLVYIGIDQDDIKGE